MWNGYRSEQAIDKDFGNFHGVPIFMGHTPVSNYTGSTSILISGKKVFVDGGLAIKGDGKLLVAVLNEDDSISEMSYERDTKDV
jgi:fructose-1,6-bisphosphatase